MLFRSLSPPEDSKQLPSSSEEQARSPERHSQHLALTISRPSSPDPLLEPLPTHSSLLVFWCRKPSSSLRERPCSVQRGRCKAGPPPSLPPLSLTPFSLPGFSPEGPRAPRKTAKPQDAEIGCEAPSPFAPFIFCTAVMFGAPSWEVKTPWLPSLLCQHL